jgi:hypothetical protein
METIVNLHKGFHLNVFPIIIAALLFFIIIYMVTGKKPTAGPSKKALSRSEGYKLIYNLPRQEENTAPTVS